MITQAGKILWFMQKYGSITPLDALGEFGCMRLASRISDLKREGFSIRKTMEKSQNRCGDTVHYARYFLEDNNE